MVLALDLPTLLVELITAIALGKCRHFVYGVKCLMMCGVYAVKVLATLIVQCH